MKINFASVGLILLVMTTWQCGQSEAEMNPTNQVDHSTHQYTNHLINETSPYLLLHAHNPVNWYPWGDEALSLARAQNKPIFLSIGYSACHWCHVMERESFENEFIADILNEHFISIKVDREQRPDLDEIYMAFTTAMTGHGGWPMSVFLTPDLMPFFAGTYFPPEDQAGRPGFKRLVTEIGKAWGEQNKKILASSANIYELVSNRVQPKVQPGQLNRQMVAQTADALMLSIDRINGGFGRSPKFPHATELAMFLRYYEQSGDSTFLRAAELALKSMSRGGIFDQVGGGFARYATDEKWLVPHFEKMLYDNSLLVPVYVDAFRITGDKEYLETVRRTLDFMLREMVSGEGGFYSALDADSEGEEGKFYLWDRREVEQILGDKAQPFIDYHNITYKGNFEHRNIPNLTKHSLASVDKTNFANDEAFDNYLAHCRALLLTKRAERVRPATDDKILTSWNGMALSALCKGYQATRDKRYLDAAIKNARFVQSKLFNDGKLTHAYREGKYRDGEFLEDYAFYISGLLDLYESDPIENENWLKFAVTLARQAVDLFMDDNYRLYLRPADQADLIFRPQMESDGSIPSAGSYLLSSLIKLNRITGDAKFLTQAEQGLQALTELINGAPGSMSSAVCAVDYLLSDKIEVVVVGRGDMRDEMLDLVYARYQPNRILAMSDDGKSGALFEGRAIDGGDDKNVRAYICVNSTCKLPAGTSEELQRQLAEL